MVKMSVMGSCADNAARGSPGIMTLWDLEILTQEGFDTSTHMLSIRSVPALNDMLR